MPYNVKALCALLAGLSIVFFALPCSGAQSNTQNDDASLKSLYDAHRWFELRNSIAKGSAPAFYQGAVACAFSDLHRCEKKLDAVMQSGPKSDNAIEAHSLLAVAYLRQGKYREALGQEDALLALRPNDSDAQDDRLLLAALSKYPDQTVESRALTTVELGDAGLPFSIHGVQATYWFDTGAEMSVMTESEAKRFGLQALAVSVKVGDVTDTKVESRVAVADELTIGFVRLRHVAFLVVSDNQPPFNESPPGSRGLIGIPVLLALERFAWEADGKFEIGSRSSNRHAAHADMCFDGQHPIVQIQFQGHSLAFTLDTGATNTDLYPPFAAAFPELLRTAPKTDSYKIEGVGGAKQMNAAVLSSVHFSIGGFPVVLNQAGVLLAQTIGNSKFFHGNLGIDLLQQAHRTTFDFKAMTLTLQ